MKTLILNGSPRPRGDTASLISMLKDSLEGEAAVVRAYEGGISPCVDCRGCWKKKGCVIDDQMTGIYKMVEECDNVVIASPVYFSQLTGPLLSLCSRFQCYYCARRFQKTEPIPKAKRGGIILVGGGEGTAEPALKTARMLLKLVRTGDIFRPICRLDTDKTPAAYSAEIHEDIAALSSFLSSDNR